MKNVDGLSASSPKLRREGTQDSAHGPHVSFALSPKDPSQQMSCMTDWMAAGRPLYVVQRDTTVATVTVRNVTVEGAANSVRVLSRKDSHLLSCLWSSMILS